MKKQKEQIYTSPDISSFDEQVSIYKILFQDKTTSLLKYIIDKITIDRYEHMDSKLPSILLIGKEGKQLISRAFSNSLCNSYEFIQGKNLGMGGFSGSLYMNSDRETTYYINQADKLSPYTISLLHKFLTQGCIKFRDHIKGENVTVTAGNKLFIFGVRNKEKLCPDLCKAINYHCYLRNYNKEEMEILTEQRLNWCNIEYQKNIPSVIVQNGEGCMLNCIRLLSVCYLVMRANSRSNMTVKDIETGIGVNSSQKLVPAPPVADDIPF